VQLSEGLIVADRFRLVRELGRGGMGSVWLAEHTGLDILCAVKLIDPRGKESQELRARFEREAKAAAQLKSRHVVQILDHGVWQDVPYIAMEYLQGEDLAERLTRLGRLTPSETLQVIGQVGRALTRAHSAGIVHRDLKPENVFLAREDEGEIAKVLDFGIAKRSSMKLEDSGTKTGSLVGTPFYMSPEQARGTRQIDHRSDLWSLGVIVFECLTGELPFCGDGLGEVLGKIMYEALPLPSTFAPVPPGVDAWWKRAAAREPEERFQSARELCEGLALALGITQILGSSLSSPDLGSTFDGFRANTPREELPTIMALPADAVTIRGGTGDPLTRTVTPFDRRPWPWKPLAAAAAVLVVGASIGGILYARRTAAPEVARAEAAVTPPAPAGRPQAAPANPDTEPSPSSAPSEPSAEAALAKPAKAARPGDGTRAPVRRRADRTPPSRSTNERPKSKSPKTVDFGI
jgi:eukaryotic-like serine/threonine-protein kinase